MTARRRGRVDGIRIILTTTGEEALLLGAVDAVGISLATLALRCRNRRDR